MTCVWIEGFETHNSSAQIARKYASASGSGFFPSPGRVHGTSGAPNAVVATTPSFGLNNTAVIGFGLLFSAHNTSVDNNSQGLYFETGANEQLHIGMLSTSGVGFVFELYRGATLIATSSSFDFGVWHYFEWKFIVRDGTDGAYELRHNGVTDISATGLNLADNATDGWDVFAWRYTFNFQGVLRYDDVYINNGAGSKNNDFLGPSIVEGILPTAAGASTDFTPISGSNWENVDDAASATDEVGTGGYNGSDTNTDKDLYNFADLTQITGAIHAIQIGVQLGMAAAGTRTVKGVYRDPDTTEADLSSHVVDSTTYDEFTEVVEDNPASAAAWDVADLDDGQFGIEVVS